MKLKTFATLIMLIGVFLIGCTPTGGSEPVASDRPTPTSEPDPTTEPEYIAGVAPVDDVAILFLESWPLQVHVNVEGFLPDGCTSLDEPTVSRDGNHFRIELPTRIAVGVDCIDALEKYITRIPLDVLDLPAGTYTVDVNGVRSDFTFDQDNTAGQSDDPGDGDFVEGIALVDSVAIHILESFPLQMSVQVTGHLNDGCTSLAEPEINREGTVIDILLPTVRPADMMCTQALVPYDTNIPVDILGLTAGTYTVNVNGVAEEFTLTQDNVIPAVDDSLTDADRAELVLETLHMALVEGQIPDLQLLLSQGTPILSTGEIDPAWLEGTGTNVIVMTPEEIQAKADAEGDFLHLRFDKIVGVGDGEAIVQISNAWAIAAGSNVGYLSGGGFEVHFTRTADGWEGEIVSIWIS